MLAIETKGLEGIRAYLSYVLWKEEQLASLRGTQRPSLHQSDSLPSFSRGILHHRGRGRSRHRAHPPKLINREKTERQLANGTMMNHIPATEGSR